MQETMRPSRRAPIQPIRHFRQNSRVKTADTPVSLESIPPTLVENEPPPGIFPNHSITFSREHASHIPRHPKSRTDILQIRQKASHPDTIPHAPVQHRLAAQEHIPLDRYKIKKLRW